MLRVATVLSAREWEARLVAVARDTAAVKLVLRAFLPDEVSTHAASIDVVVAGAETPWVTPTRVAAWRRLGLRVVGLHARTDRPAAERLTAGGADLVLADDLEADQIVREIRLLDLAGEPAEGRNGSMIVVTGVSGGIGITEVALALAWNESGRGRTVLLDGDLASPSIAVRLGLRPRPDLCDVVDASLGNGIEPTLDRMPSMGRLTVIPGAIRPFDTGLRIESVVDIAEAVAAEKAVVIDAGEWPTSRSLVREADQVVVVVPSTPVGVVRLARLVESWAGPQPELVVNAVTGREGGIAASVRRWSGLDPTALIPLSDRIRRSGASGAPPHRSIRRRLRDVGSTSGG